MTKRTWKPIATDATHTQEAAAAETEDYLLAEAATGSEGQCAKLCTPADPAEQVIQQVFTTEVPSNTFPAHNYGVTGVAQL